MRPDYKRQMRQQETARARKAALIQGLADDLYEADAVAGTCGLDEDGALAVAGILVERGWRR